MMAQGAVSKCVYPGDLRGRVFYEVGISRGELEGKRRALQSK